MTRHLAFLALVTLCSVGTPAEAAPWGPVIITLDGKAFANLKEPAEQTAEHHARVLKAAFPGFFVGTHSWQFGVNRFSRNPGGDPLFEREFVVQRGADILFGTASIHSSSLFWVRHPGVAGPLGLRLGDTYGRYVPLHGTQCSRQQFSSGAARLANRKLLICESDKGGGKYFFALTDALYGAKTMPSQQALKDAELISFAVGWRSWMKAPKKAK